MNFWSIIIAILVLGFLVLSHELGHFIFAKKAGIGVTEFSIGMGPRLFHFTRGETMYSIKAIPFGGSCAMIGEDTESDADNSFQKKGVWARILVVAGGPLFNFIVALIFGIIIIACLGVNKPIIYTLTPGFGAERAGLRLGDEIISINGSSIHTGRELYLYLIANPLDGTDVTIEYERNGVEHETTVKTAFDEYRFGFSYTSDDSKAELLAVTEGGAAAAAGIKAGDVVEALNGETVSNGSDIEKFFAKRGNAPDEVLFKVLRDGQTLEISVTPVLFSGHSLGLSAYSYREDGSFFEVIKGGFDEMRYGVKCVFSSLKMLFNGSASIKDIAGPVGIVSVVDNTIESASSSGFGFTVLSILSLMVLLSTNLGIMNILPFPALDGGRLVFLLFEAITGKRVPPDKEGMVHFIGFALLMVLMVFILFNDITRLFG